MATQKQEDFERNKVTRFLNLLDGEYHSLEKNDEPEPDFTFYRENKRIGIEETQIYFKDENFVRQQFVSNCETIVGLAQKLFEERNSTYSLLVQVSFTDNYGTLNFDSRQLLNRHDIKCLPMAICQLVEQFLPKMNGEFVYIDQSILDPEKEMPDKIEQIFVENTTGKFPSVWAAIFGIVVPHLTSDLVQKTIDGKNKKIENYSDQFCEIWLLLTLNSFNPSSYFEVLDEVRGSKFASNFDKVFIYDTGDDLVLNLDLNK